MTQDEIILYKADSLPFEIQVKIEDDTVWLTQNQMVELFDSTKQNISLHISNIFKEGELDKNSVVKEYLTTAKDGKNYRTRIYNLDVIISVVYNRNMMHLGLHKILYQALFHKFPYRFYSLNNFLLFLNA